MPTLYENLALQKLASGRIKFVPNKDYTGPPIELTCGTHTRAGKFRPKNVKPERRSPSRGRDLDQICALYCEAMKRKDPTWSLQAAEQRWNDAFVSYGVAVREARIERHLDKVRRKQTRAVLRRFFAAEITQALAV